MCQGFSQKIPCQATWGNLPHRAAVVTVKRLEMLLLTSYVRFTMTPQQQRFGMLGFGMGFFRCSQDIELWKLVELILFNRLYWYKLWYNWNKFAPDGASLLLLLSSWSSCLQCLVCMHTKSATLFIPRQKQTLCIEWSECTEHEPYYVSVMQCSRHMRYTDFDVVWFIWEQDENPTCRCCM